MTDDRNPALYCPDAERSVIGAILLTEQHLTTLLVDEHLQPEHFADPALATIYQAAIELQDLSRPVDHLTVAEHLRDNGLLDQAGGANMIEELTAWVPATGNTREYGRLVRGRHQARQLLTATHKIQAAVLGRTAPIDVLLEQADELLTNVAAGGRHGGKKTAWTAEELRSEFFDELGQPAGAVYRTPFLRLDRWLDGGLRPGDMCLIGGHEKHGKSVIVDQFLEELADQDLRVQLYINEMGRRNRMNRMVARLSGVSASDLRRRNLTVEQARDATGALPRVKVGITHCHGWTAPEIARDIKRNGWDACCVDIAHNITKTESGTEGSTAIAQTMRDVSLQAETVLLVVVHLNRNRAGEQPMLADIRDTGMWEKLADQVLFIHRDKDQFGMFENTGELALAAARDGETGLMKVSFDPVHMRFLPVLPDAAGKGIRADQWRPSPDSRIESGSNEFVVGDGVSF